MGEGNVGGVHIKVSQLEALPNIIAQPKSDLSVIVAGYYFPVHVSSRKCNYA